MRLLILLALAAASAFAEPPRIVSMTPDNGDTGVDPALTEIRLEFDQDMAQDNQSICGGGDLFPKMTARVRWDSARVMVMPVKLEANHVYTLSVNCPSFRNFRSLKGGESAEITPLWFRTGDGAAAPPPPLTAHDNTKACEALRKAIDQRYSYRDLRVKDWDAVFNPVKDKLIEAKSRAAFARTAARALAAAGDLHMSLAVGEARFPTFRANNVANIDAGLVRQIVPEFNKANNTVTTGQFEDGIGYIGIAGWPDDLPSLAPAHAFLDKFKGKALIIDVRANGGGDELAAKRFASRFIREETMYSRNRSRDEQGNWTGVMARTIEPSTEPHFDGPVVVLMGQACVSSNESFLLMMKHGAAAKLIGQPTCGSSGNPKPVDLGNGVTVILPSWEDQLPDGTILEGRGVKPDITADLGADPARDGVLEAALAALRQQPR